MFSRFTLAATVVALVCIAPAQAQKTCTPAPLVVFHSPGCFSLEAQPAYWGRSFDVLVHGENNLQPTSFGLGFLAIALASPDGFGHVIGTMSWLDSQGQLSTRGCKWDLSPELFYVTAPHLVDGIFNSHWRWSIPIPPIPELLGQQFLCQAAMPTINRGIITSHAFICAIGYHPDDCPN